jgi:hypothetical protein
MAHGIGRTKRQAILDNLFNGAALSAESAWHCSLHTGDPGPDGQTANEVGGGVGYARVSVGSNWSAATAAEPSVVDNEADITFAAASGAGFGTITFAAIWNHTSATAAANFICRVALTPSQAVAAGNVAVIPLGTLDISLGVT